MKSTLFGRAAIVALAIAAASCGSVVRDGAGTSFLVVNVLEGASGARPSEFGGTLLSDVVTIVDDNATLFNDLGRVSLSLGLKDPGSASSPNVPTQNQAITVDRYRVRFIRADGRNTPGVDVPYGFDGAFTLTVTGGASASIGFDLVKNSAKQEAPLAALARTPVLINTIAEVTFFGRDLTGREASAIGRISVTFGNFGDPQ
jgi:hypothetical protein